MAENISRIVIAGAGQAGGWAAKTLRAQGFDGTITLIGVETHQPYERPPLSKSVLTGEASPESCNLFSPQVFEALSLDFHPGVEARSIDRAKQQLALSNGAIIDYDRLILATGGRARPFSSEIAGDIPIHTLRTIEDAVVIGAALEEANRALIIGGGWIGLEIAAGARSKQVNVTVLERETRLCHRVVPETVSNWLLGLHRQNGVDVQLGIGLTTDHMAGVDVIIAGIGLIANDGLASQAGLECDNGIVTDACGRTQDQAIFACGDVSVFTPRGADHPMRLESWANAQNQAIACARAVLGKEAIYNDIPWFWSDQYGVNIQILGFPSHDAQPLVRGDMGDESFSLFWLDGDHLEASLSVNAPHDIKVAKRLMAQRKPVCADQLTDLSKPFKSLLK